VTAGLLDTSVLISWDDPAVAVGLPDDSSVCAVTMAELAAGPHTTTDPAERARRQARLQQVESLFDPLPIDAAVCRSYGQVVAAVVEAGRRTRGRFADLLIAATAHANGLPVYTRNPDDFRGLEDLITVNPL
jgi:predicted nucleic acid-binding protein